MNIVMILVNIINKNSTPEAPYLIIGSTDASKYNLIPPIEWIDLTWRHEMDLETSLWAWKFEISVESKNKIQLLFQINGKVSKWIARVPSYFVLPIIFPSEFPFQDMFPSSQVPFFVSRYCLSSVGSSDANCIMQCYM